jgi:hypothetical protein
MEEKRMHRRFGTDYQEYNKQEVSRFFPALGNLGQAVWTTSPFGWGLAWRKEYESCCGWLAGFAMLQAYEGILAAGWERNWPFTLGWILFLGVLGLVAIGLSIRKRMTYL